MKWNFEWITCENVYDESWKRLLEYANVQLTEELISEFHGPPKDNSQRKKDNSQRKNYKKQARQVRVCLLQAKEYFDAARSASIFTQGNHLYYGIVALSTACMLIRGDGEKSLDRLRQNKNNAHHGLNFSCSLSETQVAEGLTLLDNAFIEVCSNGHFKNWYDTLNTQQPYITRQVLKSSKKYEKVECKVVNNYQLPEFKIFKDEQKKTISFLSYRLPDLHAVFGRYRIEPLSVRGTFDVHADYQENNLAPSNHVYSFILNEAYSLDFLNRMINRFECAENGDVKVEVKLLSEQDKSVIIHVTPGKELLFKFPSYRETLDCQKIFFENEINVPEIVDLFLASYALSMLSRYYPDLWVSFLESHCKGAKLIERIINILIYKVPNLMLNQITNQYIVISNHLSDDRRI